MARKASSKPADSIYDPACGSGGRFVQSGEFVESHGGKLGDISIYGQESNATTRRLAIRGIEADIGKEHADNFSAPSSTPTSVPTTFSPTASCSPIPRKKP